ncbi:MAG: GIY-YIG nuclease family protein, partial [Pseudomonadota bacterium]
MSTATLTGTKYLKQRVKELPQQPGVYQMYGAANHLLYIGKAKCLARRVNDYTNYHQLSARIGRMVSQVVRIEYVITKTEAEALLLEANLVKQRQPKYNILLKDDKSYPFVVIDRNHNYPRIVKYRGKVQKNSDYYGPFASAKAVDLAIAELQRIFLLRPCSDNYFNSRKRPCLQYQIKRCSGPCVGKIKQHQYSELVNQARQFLNGKASQVRTQLT